MPGGCLTSLVDARHVALSPVDNIQTTVLGAPVQIGREPG